MTNISHHLRSHEARTGHVLYRFPNGIEVSVIPDPSSPLHWELLADGSPVPEVHLTTDAVKQRLAGIADLPMPEWNGAS